MLNKIIAFIFFLFSSFLYAQDTYYQITVGSHFYNAMSKSDVCSEAISDLGSIGLINSTYSFTSVNGVSCQMTSPLFGVSSISPLTTLVCPSDLPIYSHSQQKCVPPPTYCRDYGYNPLLFIDLGQGFCPNNAPAGAASCLRFEDQKIYKIPACKYPNAPRCSDIGFNPGFFDTGSGFCPNNTTASTPAGCLGLDLGFHLIPPCTLATCPDGSKVNTAFDETCFLPSQCWDGSIVFLGNGGTCPDPPFICPDGSKVASIDNCPSPNEELILCQDGSHVRLSEQCIKRNDVICSDGSTAVDIQSCPTASPKHSQPILCKNGVVVQEAVDCPAPQITINHPNDTSTTTNNTTVATTVNGVTTTTTTTTTETTQLNLDGVNSRLDRVADNTDKTQFFLDDINKKLIQKTVANGKTIYQRSNKTVDGALAAFYSDIETSNLFVEVTGVFTVTPNTGSCPIFTIPAVMGMPAIVIDQFCSTTAFSAYSIINAVLFFVASLITIRLMLGS